VHEGEDIKNASRIISSKDAQDCYGILTGELEYETTACSVQSYNCRFSHICLTSKNVEYSILCRSVSDCFGCANVKSGQYMILNKQYTKEEFEEIVPKLRQHMMDMPYVDKKGRVYKYGEFFPFEFCPFGYNESVAHDYFRLEKEEAIERGYNWKEREKRGYNTTVDTENIPDDINFVDEVILQETLSCAHKGVCNHQCTNAFRISQNELIFLKQKKLPLSDLCPNCRHYERVDLRNPP
jgi:hypothetical protein